MAKCIQEIFEMFEAKKLKPAETKTSPLNSFAEALEDVVERRARGRIILVPSP